MFHDDAAVPVVSPHSRWLQAESSSGLTRPDYSGQGLFNLAVSLGRACGVDANPDYADLRLADGLPAGGAWQKHDVIVFLLIDGLGDDFLAENRALAPNLWRDRQSRITSVFPSTTATAITTLMTAEPATSHGLLGWHVRDEASDSIVAPLPMRVRGSTDLAARPVAQRLLSQQPMMRQAQRQTHFVTLEALTHGAYSHHHAAGAKIHAYEELEGLPASVRAALEGGTTPSYVYAYTPLLDSTAHDFGIDSDESRQVLQRVDAVYAELRRCLPQVLLVAAADHGFIDNNPAHQLDLTLHPDLLAMLRSPLSGERRAAYCHVKPEYVEEFGARVSACFGEVLIVLRAEEAFAAGLFGPGVLAPETRARCGDWILIGREDWVVLDRLEGEKSHPMIGVHGGLSSAEMWVPLIVSEPVT